MTVLASPRPTPVLTWADRPPSNVSEHTAQSSTPVSPRNPAAAILVGWAVYVVGVALYLHDALECDAAATLTDAQAETIVRALEAAMGVR